MRQDRRLGVALLVGVLSVGALAASGQLLDAADFVLPSRPAQQQTQPATEPDPRAG